MSALAILLDACTLAGVQVPGDFYALPEYAQGMWLAHARNKASGAYQRSAPAPEDHTTKVNRLVTAARDRGALPPVED